MQKVRFDGATPLQKDKDNFGIKFNFTCLTCKTGFGIETFDSEEGNEITTALENGKAHKAVYCEKCITNQMKNN